MIEQLFTLFLNNLTLQLIVFNRLSPSYFPTTCKDVGTHELFLFSVFSLVRNGVFKHLLLEVYFSHAKGARRLSLENEFQPDI